MATIQTVSGKGGKSYRVLIRLRGYPTQTETFSRLTDARRWAVQTEAAIRENRHFGSQESAKHTVEELLDRYADEMLESFADNERRNRVRQLDWWRQQLGHLTLADLTPAVISKALTLLKSGSGPSGRPVSAATRNRYLSALSHALTLAWRDWNWLPENPARRLRRSKEGSGRVRFLDDGERSALLDACAVSENPRLTPLVVLALCTGARQGELLRLRWSDVDLTRRALRLLETKNGEPHAVPLTQPAIEALRKIPRRLGSDLLFATLDGQVTFPRKAWEKALRDSGVENFRFHDLRHSCASYLAMAGATIREIQEILGHKSIQMTMRYSHLSEQHLGAVADRMAEKFLNRVS
jgi:integrase